MVQLILSVLALIICVTPLNSDSQDDWPNQKPLDVTVKFYFFNITNTYDLTYNMSIPKLKEVGPYAYREMRKKEDIRWSKDDETVSYKIVKSYFFLKNESIGTEDDLITIPNIPLFAIVTLFEDFPENQQESLSLILTKIPLYVTKKVSELLFDGYFDPLIKTAQSQSGVELFPNNMFGLFVGRNGTDDGKYKIYTGMDDPIKFARIVSWNDMKRLNNWEINSPCNDINGTDGNDYVSYIKKNDNLYVFLPEICRSIFFQYDSEFRVENFIYYKFKITFDLFSDILLNEDNACFCHKKECFEAGVFRMHSCTSYPSPIAFSAPHFYLSEPSLLETVEGLKPSALLHSSHIIAEPIMGKIMEAVKRLQINLIMKQSESRYLHLPNIPQVIFPIVWKEEIME